MTTQTKVKERANVDKAQKEKGAEETTVKEEDHDAAIAAVKDDGNIAAVKAGAEEDEIDLKAEKEVYRQQVGETNKHVDFTLQVNVNTAPIVPIATLRYVNGGGPAIARTKAMFANTFTKSYLNQQAQAHVAVHDLRRSQRDHPRNPAATARKNLLPAQEHPMAQRNQNRNGTDVLEEQIHPIPNKRKRRKVESAAKNVNRRPMPSECDNLDHNTGGELVKPSYE